MAVAIAALQVGHLARHRGALGAELLNDRGVQGFAHIAAVGPCGQLLLGGVEAGIILGHLGARLGQGLIIAGDFLLGEAGA